MIKIERVTNSSQYIIDTLNNLLPQLGADCFMSQSLLKKMLESDDIYLLVAKESDQIVGTLTLALYPIPTGWKAWIEDVVVDINQRGKGIAKKLVREAISYAEEREVASLNLSSRPEREAANKLYQSMGFEIRKTNFYRYNSEE